MSDNFDLAIQTIDKKLRENHAYDFESSKVPVSESFPTGGFIPNFLFDQMASAKAVESMGIGPALILTIQAASLMFAIEASLLQVEERVFVTKLLLGDNDNPPEKETMYQSNLKECEALEARLNAQYESLSIILAANERFFCDNADVLDKLEKNVKQKKLVAQGKKTETAEFARITQGAFSGLFKLKEADQVIEDSVKLGVGGR